MRKENTSTRLKKIMQLQNLKQKDILKLCEPICKKYTSEYGKKMKISKSDLSQWISGKYEPGQWKLSILAEALNVEPAWLMGYEVPMMNDNKDTSSMLQEKLKNLSEEQKKAVINLIDNMK